MRIEGMSQEVKSSHHVRIYQQLTWNYQKFKIGIDFCLDMLYFKKF